MLSRTGDEELTSSTVTTLRQCRSSAASNNEPEVLSAEPATSKVNLLIGSPSSKSVVSELEVCSEVAWTPEPAMLDAWTALLGPDGSVDVPVVQLGVESEVANGIANLKYPAVSSHDVSTMTDVIKCDVAVQVAPSCDASVQAVTVSHGSSTQTPRSGALYLPGGVSLERLLTPTAPRRMWLATAQSN